MNRGILVPSSISTMLSIFCEEKKNEWLRKPSVFLFFTKMAGEFTTDMEYINQFIMHSLHTFRFTPIGINDAGDIFGPDGPFTCDPNMRATWRYTDVIGKVSANGRATIHGEEYDRTSFATEHSFAAEVAFWPYMSEIIRCMEPRMVIGIKKAYVAVDNGYDGKWFTEDGKHYGTATVFYQM